jgi:hypothetical protein
MAKFYTQFLFNQGDLPIRVHCPQSLLVQGLGPALLTTLHTQRSTGRSRAANPPYWLDSRRRTVSQPLPEVRHIHCSSASGTSYYAL